MKKVKYERKNDTIHNLETGKKTMHKSINLAKKESRKLQMDEDKALGRGCLRVVTKFSKPFKLTG